MRVEYFLEKERQKRRATLTFTRVFALIFGVVAGIGFGFSYVSILVGVVAFFGGIICFGLSVLVGDWLTHGESLVKQEIGVWYDAVKRLRNSDFVWAFSGLWGLATLMVMIPIGLAAYLNHNLLVGLLAAFLVVALSVVVYFFLPPVLNFLFERVMKGPEEGVDYEDEA